MKNIDIEKLASVIRCLATLESNSTSLDGAYIKSIIERLKATIDSFDLIGGMGFSIKQLDRAIFAFETFQQPIMQRDLQEVIKRIQDELSSYIFIQIDPKNHEFFEQKEPLFGNVVRDRFPDATFDIEEAGKCFALGRYTASVLHCMRVVELAIKGLEDYLKKNLEPTSQEEKPQKEPNGWADRFRNIEAKLENLKKRPEWKKHLEFQKVLDRIKRFKCIRNPILHADTFADYNEGDAMSIYLSVKSLMQAIASLMDESGLPLSEIQDDSLQVEQSSTSEAYS